MGDDKKSDNFDAELINIIQSTKIFADIDVDACRALLPHLELIFLEQGDILFKEGDPSDCLYILVEGQLISTLLNQKGKTQVVGVIEKGETVGELGALSNRQRSLTVQASTDSKLLTLQRDKFEQFCLQQPDFISRIFDIVVSRSQSTISLIAKKKIYRHIVIIAGHPDAPLEHFFNKLKDAFSQDSSFFFIDGVRENKTFTDLIERVESENKNAIFILQENIYRNSHIKLNHIDSVFVVVDGDRPTQLSDFALTILNRSSTPIATQYELVLVHNDAIKAPAKTKYWLTQSNFTLHHHVRKNDDKDYQRVKRFMQGKAVGVIFSGGGQKGWGCIGALKAILEAKIPIDAIGGTSVGAVAAGCYAKYLNFSKAYTAFKNNSLASQNFFGIRKLTLPLISIITSKSQTYALMKAFPNIQIEDLWIPFFAITSNLSTGNEIVHREGLLWEKLRASAALPGIASPIVMNGELHYDGGLLNNLPVDRMRDLLGNEGFTIAVSLTGGRFIPNEHYNFPPIIPFRLALMEILKMGRKNYKFPPFFNTFVNALFLGASSKESANQLLADVCIKPDLNKFNLLKISNKAIEEMIDISYEHSKEKLKNFNFK